MSILRELRDRVIEDGTIDTDETTEIRGVIFADDMIELDEAVMLFEINNAVSGNPDNDPAWDDLFVEAITEYVLQDEDSPGTVDDEEADFLIDQIDSDGALDDLEVRLLNNIETRATSISPILGDYLDAKGL